MDYHQDRFQDASLMVFKKDDLIAVLPANANKMTLHSHQGLSYGGLILHKGVRFKEAFEVFKMILGFVKKEGYETIRLKLLPKIYNDYPSDEMDYFLFLVGAKLFRRDLSSAVLNTDKIQIQSNRLEGVKKATKQNLTIKEESVFDAFWNEILEPNLLKKHQAKPVHTLNEITLLKSKFPNNIRQFSVYKEGAIVAGTTIFETPKVAHVQYISANKDKQRLGSLDFLFDYLINAVYRDKMYFDFGMSNENEGRNINQGLINWKEGFGARSVIHDFYEIDLNQLPNLDMVFI